MPREADTDISAPAIRSAFSHLFCRLNKLSSAAPYWWVMFAGIQVIPTALVCTFSPFISPFNTIYYI